MGLISPATPNLGDARGTGEAAVRNDIIALLAEFNGNIDNANIKSGAGIDGSKIAAGTIPADRLAGAANVQTLAAATSLTYSGLTGDTDLAYELLLLGTLAKTGAARYITVRPNNDTTGANYVSQRFYENGSGTGQDAPSVTGLLIGASIAAQTADDVVLSRSTIMALSGRQRLASVQSSIYNAASQRQGAIIAATWLDTATVITSLVVDFGGGAFTGRAILRKLGA